MYCDTTNLNIKIRHAYLGKTTCFDYGGDYVTHFYNFDNIIKSMMTLITVTFTNDSWINIMYNNKYQYIKIKNYYQRLSLSSITRDKHNPKGIYEYDRSSKIFIIIYVIIS